MSYGFPIGTTIMRGDMRSLQSRARRAGVIYAVMSAVGAPALLFIPKFVVAGDPAATARNIASGEQVYRLLMLGDLAGSILFAVLGWSLYHLFEQVDRKQASLLLTLAQLDALAFGGLRLRSFEVHANEALWGLWLVPFGVLIIKSGFIPKLIGVLLLIASTGYVAMSVAYIAFPAYLNAVDRVASVLIQGELAVILWLLIKGARREVTSPSAGVLAEASPG